MLSIGQWKPWQAQLERDDVMYFPCDKPAQQFISLLQPYYLRKTIAALGNSSSAPPINVTIGPWKHT